MANSQIQFKLATKDPKGKTTDGIIRTKTDRTEFIAEEDSIKSTATGGIDPWPTDKYLNMWFCGTLKDARGT